MRNRRILCFDKEGEGRRAKEIDNIYSFLEFFEIFSLQKKIAESKIVCFSARDSQIKVFFLYRARVDKMRKIVLPSARSLVPFEKCGIILMVIPRESSDKTPVST